MSSADETTVSQGQWDPAAHYRKRCSEIERRITELRVQTSGVVVLVGNSITEGISRSSLGGKPVINQGISGDQIDRPEIKAGVRNRLGLVAAARPAHVFLLIGINDFWGGGKSAEQATVQYSRLLRELRQAVPQAAIYVQSVMPTGEGYEHLQQKVDALNSLLPKMAEGIGAKFINLDPLLKGNDGKMRPEFTTDGVHLSPAGYQVWIAKLEEELSGVSTSVESAGPGK